MPYNAKTNWQYDDVVTENDLNRIEQGVADAHNQLDPAAPIPITLTRGVQKVTSARDSVIRNVRIRGRTLVNLVGRAGNCEDANQFLDSQTTHTLDATNKTNGNYGLKVTIASGSSGYVGTKNGVTVDQTKYYILLGMLKNGNASGGVSLSIFLQDAATKTNVVTDTTKFVLAYKKFTGIGISNAPVKINVEGAAGQFAYADEIRLYEITAAEYAALDSMTPEQIAQKYPYVDDMRHVNAVYAINPGRNLLPPFTETRGPFSGGWFPYLDTKFSVSKPYEVTIQATGNDKAIQCDIPCIPGQTYTLSVGSKSAGALIGFNTYDRNGNFLNAFGGFTSANTKTVTVDANAAFLRVIIGNELNGAGNYTFSDVMFNLGPTALPFEPQDQSYMFLPDVNLAANLDGSVADELYFREGRPVVNRRWKEIVLDGSLNWGTSSRYTGFLQVRLTQDIGAVPNSGVVIKHDGKILQLLPEPGNPSAVDQFSIISSDRNLRITIPNSDSGWGDNYTPTADEIKAYFNGWKMHDGTGAPYNGSGTKTWRRITDGGGDTTTLPKYPVDGYTPYRLLYQLASAVEEPVTHEGVLRMHEGDNQIEVGTGVVVREAAKPVLSSDGKNYIINSDFDANERASRLAYRANKIAFVYKNGRMDSGWRRFTGFANGKEYVYIDAISFDKTASYTVTYFTLDTHLLGIAPEQITGELAANLREAVDELVSDVAWLARDVAALQIAKAEKAQPVWVAPVLLNGWVNYLTNETVEFLKDSTGFVFIKGRIKNGMTTNGTILFYLPKGYRPKGNLVFTVATSSDGGVTNSAAEVAIWTDGGVRAYFAKSSYLSLAIPPFRSEQ